MRRRKVTARFYIFMAALLVALFFLLRPLLNFGSNQDVIIVYNAPFTQKMDCIFIRDEKVIASDSTVRVEYVATENTLVSKGETVANLYTTGYTENLLSRLETTRQNIQAYHKTLLGTIVDNDLTRLDTIIDMMSLEFKNLVTDQSKGNLQTVTEQLETAMVNRQEYLRQNKRDDTKLTKLYEEENARLNNIQSWRKVSTAEAEGVISFYLDGYENDLTADTIEELNATKVRTVLTHANLPKTAHTLSTGIYRLVNQDKWYVAVLSNSEAWNPVVNQEEYFLQFDGFEDLSFTAVAVYVQKENGSTVAVFEINDPIGPLIYQRTGKATLSITRSGLAVHTRCLSNQNGQLGVWISDVPGGTFVPVNVLSADGEYSLIQPVVEGSLQQGQLILIK